ncbi:MAG TPA: ATP-binding SpoIIE family protein phosphatase [Planctomycetota bacterium]|nr:ATP-binding SpoIIE family protein phosphatase [Planctomycetota bacterium]
MIAPIAPPALLAVPDLAAVGEARRAVASFAESVGLGADALGRLALIATEAATNLARHAGGGSLLLRRIGSGRARGVEVVAVDRGRGMEDVGRCLRDGFSTSGTRGEGLGAISRRADLFDIWSQPGKGTVVMARVVESADEPVESLPTGAVNVALAHQPISGDAWAVNERPDAVSLCLVDGLGHGPHAAEAAHEALRVFREQAGAAPEEALRALHLALMKSRGAAASICRIPRDDGPIRFAGIGNVAGTVVTRDGRRGMLCHNGILGHQVGRIGANDYAAASGDLIVLHSDGLTMNWELSAYPGLSQRHPAIVAAILWRDHARGRDDACVVVVRRGTPG